MVVLLNGSARFPFCYSDLYLSENPTLRMAREPNLQGLAAEVLGSLFPVSCLAALGEPVCPMHEERKVYDLIMYECTSEDSL